ncbi:MAG: 3-dehydroquinate synthase [Microcoleaceae cyanobacterium]
MSSIPVNLGEKSYTVEIAAGNLERLGELIQPLNLGRKVVLVSNPEIFQHYGESALASLVQAGFDVTHCLLPAGEAFKNLTTLQEIYDAALAHRLERSSCLVALGGGVVGDMTGFAAATWLRGIQVVQVPTSLLAMVDAAIGGKTGVNHPQGKNLIGAFHQPKRVVIDPNVLQTLPEREFRAGMAEVIKYGVIWDAELFEQLERAEALDRMSTVSPELLQNILERSCQSKAEVVSKDEKEGGLRAILNYGHTIGHAVESLTGYTTVIHGEAVGIGMVAASQLAVHLNLWDEECDRRQLALAQTAGLPTELPDGLDIDEILSVLQTDKKVKAGKVRFVLPQAIGQAIVTDQVPEATIRQVLQNLEQQ